MTTDNWQCLPKEKLTNPFSKPTFSFRNNRNEHSFTTLAAAPPDSVEYELAPYYFFAYGQEKVYNTFSVNEHAIRRKGVHLQQ
jgi:hypothetical protein